MFRPINRLHVAVGGGEESAGVHLGSKGSEGKLRRKKSLREAFFFLGTLGPTCQGKSRKLPGI